MAVWYASVLGACLVIYGGFTFVGLSRYLHHTLERSLSRQAHVIADRLRLDISETNTTQRIRKLGPELNISGLFVRISNTGGKVLYTSPQLPRNQSFDPARIPLPSRPTETEFVRDIESAGRSPVVVDTVAIRLADGETLLVEVGSDTEQIVSVLRGLRLALILSIPLLVTAAIGGAILVSRKAMQPLNAIADLAERFTSHSFGLRLPVIRTGDEVERLTLSLNRMIGRLEEAFRLNQRFSADVSHELRTPLAILRGELELVQRAKDLPDNLADRIGSSLEEIERLSRIVSQLLEISRVEAGQMVKDPTPIDLGALAMNTSEQMRLLADVKSVALNYKISQGCFVDGSAGLLKQVIANLLDNSIKYTDDGGVVDVIVCTVADKVRLEVRDNGAGIPQPDIPRIFDRFYRADPARSQNVAGAGLGLAIVKSICVAHGAVLDVVSTVGIGTAVTVDFPRAEDLICGSDNPVAASQIQQSGGELPHPVSSEK
jgi:heavy metal sensor kinase